jgi:hypothetical protein
VEEDGSGTDIMNAWRRISRSFCAIALLFRTIAPLSCTIALLFCPVALVHPQGSAGSDGGIEPRYLIDIPTAGMLHKGNVALDVDFYQAGGVLTGVSVGVFDRLTLGLSYGGSRLIGSETPIMNEVPGFIVKVRLFEESIAFPALALGFDSQGRDGYVESLDRYVIKSPGFFVTLSKNYALLGFFSIHGGANYSLERADGDRDFNLFAGVEKTLGPTISLVAEYNVAMNDNSAQATGRGWGYLNAALRWSIGGGLTLALNMKDIIHNTERVSVANRTVRLEWVKGF